jgi:hypothetical protein
VYLAASKEERERVREKESDREGKERRERERERERERGRERERERVCVCVREREKREGKREIEIERDRKRYFIRNGKCLSEISHRVQTMRVYVYRKFMPAGGQVFFSIFLDPFNLIRPSPTQYTTSALLTL